MFYLNTKSEQILRSIDDGNFINYTLIGERLSSNQYVQGSAPRWFLPSYVLQSNATGQTKASKISNVSVTLVVVDSAREKVESQIRILIHASLKFDLGRRNWECLAIQRPWLKRSSCDIVCSPCTKLEASKRRANPRKYCNHKAFRGLYI